MNVKRDKKMSDEVDGFIGRKFVLVLRPQPQAGHRERAFIPEAGPLNHDDRSLKLL